MTQPFFTIIIPTRERPKLFRDALASALWQDFADFEVVASDNYNDSQTQTVLDEFKEDPRLRSVRTDRLLNMPEHWDFATQHALGRYVLILTDRSVLKQGALRTIHDAISSFDKPIELCSWRWSVYDDNSGCEYDKEPVLQDRTVRTISTIKLLEDFTSGQARYYKCLPRGLNSCYKNSIVQQIRKEFGSPFRPISPDYSLAFSSLGVANDLLFIDQTLFISQGLKVSNGTNCFLGKKNAAENYLKLLGDIDPYKHVPIKSPTSYNLIYEDFLTSKEIINGNLKKVEIDWSGYFTVCYKELLNRKAGGFMTPIALQSLFDEWERALLSFDQATQCATREKIDALLKPVAQKQQTEAMQTTSKACLCIDRVKWLINRIFSPFRKLEQKDTVSLEKNQALSALELAGF